MKHFIRHSSLALVGAGWLIVLLTIGCFLLLPRDVVLSRPLGGAPAHEQIILPETGLDVSFVSPVPGEKLLRLELPLAPAAGGSHLEQAWIEMENGCRFETMRALTLVQGRLVFFTPRNAFCARLRPGQPVHGKLAARASGIVALPASPGHGKGLTLRTPSGPMLADGLWARSVGRASRLGMLAWVWDFPWRLPVGLLLAAWLMAGGGLAFAVLLRVRAANILAAGLLALAAGGMYAVLTPPFHAPDENSHFYAFAKLNHRPGLLKSGMALGARGWFNQLKANRRMVLTPFHRAAPAKKASFMDDTHRVKERSALTAGYWRLLGRLFSGDEANVTLLSLRLANSLLFGLAAALAAWLLLAARPGENLFPLFLFALPGLPFLAMHLSNHALVASLCCVVTGLALGLLRRKGDWPASGILLGLSMATAMLAGRSLAGLVLGLAVLVAAVPFLASGRPWRESLVFWGGLLLGLGPIFLLWSHPQVQDLFNVSRGVLKLALSQPLHFLSGAANPFALIPVAAVGFGLERLLTRWNASLVRLTVLRWGLLGLAVALGACVALGPFIPWPAFPDIEKHFTVSLTAYLARFMSGLAASLTPRAPDFFLQASAWGGFAWLEVLLPGEVVRLLAGMLGAGLALWLWRVWHSRDDRMAAMCWAYLIAVLVVGLGTAFGAWSTKMNLHGRYLLPMYLLLLAPAVQAWISLVRSRGAWATRLGIAGLLCLHALGPLMLLERFFGCETLYTFLGYRFG